MNESTESSGYAAGSPRPGRVKCCWLHVGMHKTGSTSIQKTLEKVAAPSNWRLLRAGGRTNMGPAICAMFRRGPIKHRSFVKHGFSKEQIEKEGKAEKARLARTLRNCQQESVILSAEALSASLETKDLIALKEFLEPLCDEIRVIGYVRSPLSFKNSMFQQLIKNGTDQFSLAEIKVDYQRRFGKFDEVFGKENVILRKFDPASFPHRCIVADFCQQIGIEAPPQEAVQRTNESLSREACGILFAYRKFGPGFGVGKDVMKENFRILGAFKGIPGPRFKGSRRVMNSNLTTEAEDILWMEKRLGISLEETVTDDGTEVDSEADLLRVPLSACEAMVAGFRELYGKEIPASKIPRAAFPAPEEIAALVETCRDLGREKALEEKATESGRVKRCWLHVGMHKTGSTSIQNTLAKVRKPQGWLLVKMSGRANMGRTMSAMFTTEPLKHALFSKLGYSEKRIRKEGEAARKRLTQILKNSRQDTVIISAEALSALFKRDEIQAIKDFLEPLCEEIRVIGYVRSPVSFKNSIFQEAVKHGKGKFNPAEAKVNYRRRFKKFDDVFGKRNVILRKFDPMSFPHHCIVADFCQQIGIDEPPREAVQRTNESLSREACGILYAYRKFGPGFGVGSFVVKENVRVLAMLEGVPGPRFKASTNLMTGPLANERKDIDWMEKRLKASLKETLKDNGTEVDSEADLLCIPRSSCEAMVAKLYDLYGLEVPPSKLPQADFPSPKEISELVDYCRGLCREQIFDENAASEGWYSRIKRRIGQALAILRKCPESAPDESGATTSRKENQDLDSKSV